MIGCFAAGIRILLSKAYWSRPNALPEFFNSFGSAFSAEYEVSIMIGEIIILRINPPVSRDAPGGLIILTIGTSVLRAHRPYTTEGIPASSSTIEDRNLYFFKYKKLEQDKLIGIAMMIASKLDKRLPTIIGIIEKLPSSDTASGSQVELEKRELKPGSSKPLKASKKRYPQINMLILEQKIVLAFSKCLNPESSALLNKLTNTYCLAGINDKPVTKSETSLDKA